MLIGIANACGGTFRLNFFRSRDELQSFMDQIEAEMREWNSRPKPAQAITFSRSPDLDFLVASISVSLSLNSAGQWKANVVRSQGAIGQQAKEDHLANRPIEIEFEEIAIDQSSCPAILTLASSLVEQSRLAVDPDWRRRNGDDGLATCSSEAYSLYSDMEPKLDFVWGNGSFHAYTGWVNGSLAKIEACLPATQSH